MQNGAATTTVHLRHQTTRPLASCEERARHAFERGQISRATYQTLAGITAEATSRARQAEEEEGCADESSSSGGNHNETMACNAPCDAPSSGGWGEMPPLLPPMSGDCFAAGADDEWPSPPHPNPPLSDEGVAIGGPDAKIHSSDQSQSEYAGQLEPPPMPVSPYDESHLEMMEEQGFGLSARAAQFWAQEASGEIAPLTGQVKEEQDQRLLQFVDICLKACPPSDPSERHGEELIGDKLTENPTNQDQGRAKRRRRKPPPGAPFPRKPRTVKSGSSGGGVLDEKAERKRALDRERKRKWRARLPAEKRIKERNKARAAMARKRNEATEEEKEELREKARINMRNMRRRRAEKMGRVDSGAGECGAEANERTLE